LLRLNARSRDARGEGGDGRNPFGSSQPQQDPGRGIFDREVYLDSAEAEIGALHSTDPLDHGDCPHHEDADQRFQALVIVVEHPDAQTLELEIVETLKVLFVSIALSHVS
jgi:hypothetical protein